MIAATRMLAVCSMLCSAQVFTSATDDVVKSPAQPARMKPGTSKPPWRTRARAVHASVTLGSEGPTTVSG